MSEAVEQNQLMLEGVNVNNVTKESIDALLQILSQSSIPSQYNFNYPSIKPPNTSVSKIMIMIVLK